MNNKDNDKYDFSGYATKVGLKCSDGRTILQDAFQDSHGKTVPLVWQHLHNDPSNILGHARLENRKDGVYAYCSLNGSPAAQDAKEAVKHGDISALSIYANSLIEKGKNVIHGAIREVSLVIAGANPEAYIDNLAFEHGDGSVVEDETEAIISANEDLEFFHAEEDPKESNDDKTVAEVFETLDDTQKMVVYAMLAEALKTANEVAEEEPETKQSAIEEEEEKEIKQSIEGDTNMKKNVFDNTNNEDASITHDALSKEELQQVFMDARKSQSTLKNSFLAHGFETISEAYAAYEGNNTGALKHSITNIEYLFPDYKTLTNAPAMVAPREEWVTKVFNAARHIPFSRVKTVVADITGEEARALGYVKGNEKTEEVFALLKRTTDPQTVYKKQRLDRDDIIDITDFDVVAWLRNEMRGRLEAEIARAMLVGDGRSAASDDKIIETKIRPIATDAALYTVPVVVSPEDSQDTEPTTSELIDAIIRARMDYKGSGTPSLYIRTDLLGDMLLLKDSLGRRIYNTMEELSSALRVKEIVDVPVMDNIVNPDALAPYSELAAILVNMADYALGADKGGAVTMFDDFDIDFNQQKYLIETRVSGALTLPHSAIAFWVETTEPEVSPSGELA